MSLISPAAKMTEKLMLKHLDQVPLAAHQHGFRSRHSTTSALSLITHDITKGMNKRRPPDLTVWAAIDLSQAFDRVNIDKLVSYLLHTNINNCAIRWLDGYLKAALPRPTSEMLCRTRRSCTQESHKAHASRQCSSASS